jgi:hypothetical protein
MPIRNEADHLAAAVDCGPFAGVPRAHRILLGVGPSDDGTEQIAAELGRDRQGRRPRRGRQPERPHTRRH